MTQVDARIPLGVQPPQFENPMNMLAQVMQMQHYGDQSEMNRLKMDEYKSGVDRSNRLRGILGQQYATPDERESALLGGGFIEEYSKLSKGRSDQRTAETNEKAKQLEMVGKRLDIAGQAFGHVRQNPTLENAHMALDYLQAQGVYEPQTIAEWKQLVASDPSKIAALADQAFRAALSAKDQLPKIEQSNRGGTTDTTATDPVTLKQQTVSSVPNTATPGDLLTNARGADDLAERKRHNRAVEENSARSTSSAGTQVINDPVQGPMVVDKGTGQSRPVTAGGKPVLGEATAKAAAGSAKALTVIAEAEKLIDGATGSYIGAGVDALGRAIGQSTDGADAIAKLKVLEAQLMMAQPRMEGPQSNLDVKLYREMAGQIGDPTVPRDMKRAALASIRKLHEQYGAGATPQAPKPAAAAKPTAMSRADIEATAKASGKTVEEVRKAAIARGFKVE